MAQRAHGALICVNPNTGGAGRLVVRSIVLLIVINLAAVTLESAPSVQARDGALFDAR
jgi:hypothetical protein